MICELIFTLMGVVPIYALCYKFVEGYNRRKMLELQFKQRMELCGKTEELVQIMMADKELGYSVYKQLSAHDEIVQQLPPHEESVQVVEALIVHWSREVQPRKENKYAILTSCGLSSDKYTFIHTADTELITCKKCNNKAHKYNDL